MKLKYIIALFLYKIGIKPGVTTDIAGFISYGYGKMDSNGLWQYQLLNKHIEK